MTYRLQGCPRCGGALYPEDDADYGRVLTCLNCSNVAYPTEPLPLMREGAIPAHQYPRRQGKRLD